MLVLAAGRAKGHYCQNTSQVGGRREGKRTQLRDSVERFFFLCIKRMSKNLFKQLILHSSIEKTMKSEMRVNVCHPEPYITP